MLDFWKGKPRHCFFVFVLLFVCLFVAPACQAEEEEEAQHFVMERIAGYGNTIIDLNCVPQPAPTSFPRLELALVDWKEKEGRIRDFFRAYGYQKGGLHWDLRFDWKRTIDEAFAYVCEDKKYGGPLYGEYGVRTPIDRSEEKFLRAEKLVLHFLEELGVDYEYPFYKVKNYFQYHRKKVAIPMIEVVVRMEVEGLAYDTTVNYYPQKGPENEFTPMKVGFNPSALFLLSEDGSFLSVFIPKLLKVVDIQEDSSPLQGWRVILERNLQAFLEQASKDPYIENYFSIEQVELVGKLEEDGQFYPAWMFTVYHFIDGKFVDRHNFAFDARTGRRVDYSY